MRIIFFQKLQVIVALVKSERSRAILKTKLKSLKISKLPVPGATRLILTGYSKNLFALFDITLIEW